MRKISSYFTSQSATNSKITEKKKKKQTKNNDDNSSHKVIHQQQTDDGFRKLSNHKMTLVEKPKDIKTSSRKRPRQEEEQKHEVKSATKARYKWLVDIKDKNQKKPGEEGYNCTTLYIPQADMKKMTPGEKQYWQIKSENFDVCLFFKMGKFYELFDMDAEIGVNEFELLMMKGKRAHAGFPEMAFEKYAEQFLRKGYKVGRVEQTETPAEMKERNKTLPSGKKSKVVNRELITIYTPGTLVDTHLIGSDDAAYLLSIFEEFEQGIVKYGVCFVDTATASFCIGEFEDDRSRTRLRTLIARLRPKELVFPKNGVSDVTKEILKKDIRNALTNPVADDCELWDSEECYRQMRKYKETMPEVIKGIHDDSNALALSALGGIMWYLQRIILDMEVISIGNFRLFDPDRDISSDFLILDGHTLSNLEVLENQDGGVEHSLLSFMNKCVTGFGKRKFREWLSRPLADRFRIEDRLNCIEDLLPEDVLVESLRRDMKRLPDMERLLSRVYSFGVGRDAKAVMYENVNAKKMKIFVQVLDGYTAGFEIMKELNEHPRYPEFSSVLLKQVCGIGEGFPDLTEEVEEFGDSFDRNEVLRTGFVIPSRGFDPTYDAIEDEITNIENQLKDILEDVRDELEDHTIKFVHKNSEKYQLEISEKTLKRNPVPQNFEHMSRRKGYQRFWNSDIRNLVLELDVAIDKKEDILKDVSKQIFSRFCANYDQWRKAIDCLGTLDCLLSLVVLSTRSETDTCRPVFEDDSNLRMIEIRNGIHPCLPNCIPNDIVLNYAENEARFCLVTGPNMGGKSTLLRQACVTVMMAQMGCFVPASTCRLTMVDRVFTRLGAHDRLLSGQSTFHVELEETAAILSHSTDRSLVILDELGRGTSTFDGTAIAYAVADYLVNSTRCRTLFSTHYHSLLQTFANDPKIALYCMQSTVDEDTKSVLFLYKFVRGVCSRSFGMNVARMAGLPLKLVNYAERMSQRFERVMLNNKARKLMTEVETVRDDPEQLSTLKARAEILLSAAGFDAMNQDHE